MGRLWVLLPLQCWLWAVSVVFFSGAKWNSSVGVAEEEEAGGAHTSHVGDKVISSLARGSYPVSAFVKGLRLCC